MQAKPKRISRLLGLNNVADPTVGTYTEDGKPLTWEWQSQADNVDLSDTGRCRRRDGYQPFVEGSQITTAFSTFDFSRLYVVDAGVLKQIHADGSTTDLYSGLTGGGYWTEANDVVYLSGSQKLEILRDGRVRPWGIPVPVGGRVANATGQLSPGTYQVCFTFIDADRREGGASASLAVEVTDGGITISDVPHLDGYITAIYLAAKSTVFQALVVMAEGGAYTYAGNYPLGRELTNPFLDPPPPEVEHVAHFQGRIYASQYLDALDQSVLWPSEPLGYHLFGLNDGFIMVPGRVTQLAANAKVLLVGTQSRTFLFDGQSLDEVAEYGVLPGQHADVGPDKRIYFWTERGLCRAAPFENLTESHVSVPPGHRAGGGLLQQHGYTRYVAALQSGGAAFNKR